MEGKSEQKRSSIGLSRVSGSALCDVDKTTSGSHVASGEEDQETVPPVRLSRTVLGDGQSEKVDFNDVGTGLEDQLTNEKLQQLYQVFADADEDGGGGLDMEEFRNAMRPQMHGHVTDDELDRIFMKVDTNCDGTVDWDEYLTYMLLECRGQDTMNVKARQPFPTRFHTVQSAHRDSIIRIHFIRQSKPLSDDPGKGRYLTVSQEGVVCFWSVDMSLQTTFRVESPTKSVWVTDSVHIPSLTALAVSTTARDILFFDISAKRFSMLCRITSLDACALCLHYWSARDEPKVERSGDTGRVAQARAILLMGDAKGAVAVIAFQTDPNLTAINSKVEKKTARHRIAFQEILLDRIQGMKGYHWPEIHREMVQQVRYCQHLGCFISCAKDTDTAMFLGDIDRKITNSYFKVNKGIQSFDYNRQMNVIVTGGYDGIVRVWNPYVPAKPVSLLQGHKFPVLHVLINHAREHVISVSENKEIRVHDLSTQTCIQTFYRKMVRGLGLRKVSVMYLNQKRQSLMLATNVLVVLEPRAEEKRSAHTTSHLKAVGAALYNPLFEQVVSVSTDSMVYVWDIHTGQKVMQYKGHKLHLNGVTHDVPITTMTFDPTFRRLITGGRDGTVKIWNFNNGACLRHIDTFGALEVTSIVCPKHRIITAGWNRRVSVYVDRADDNSIRWFTPYHRDDITSLAQYNSSVLASASFDGNILLWSLETSRVLCCLNAGQSKKPIRIATYISTGSSGEGPVSNNPDNVTNGLKVQSPKGLNPSMGTQDRGTRSSSTAPTETEMRSQEKRSVGFSVPTKTDIGRSENSDMTFTYPERSIEKLLFLQSRDNDEETATLLAACTDGNVQAWAVHHRGGLLGVFPGVHISGEMVTTMTTDPQDRFLITGDSVGYIKVFDLTNYCIRGADLREVDEEFLKQREEVHAQFAFVKWKESMKTISASNWVKDFCRLEGTGKRPPLLNSYRAHVKTVSCVDFVQVNGRMFVLSASSDCSVRLWTLAGIFLGIFGQRETWSLIPEHSYRRIGMGSSKDAQGKRAGRRPEDIHRVGSPSTLAVLNADRRSTWRFTRNIIKWLVRLPSSREDDSPDLLEDAGSSVASFTSAKAETHLREDTASSILGRGYRRTTRHRPLPVLPKPRNCGTKVYSVYACLPCRDLQPVSEVRYPDNFKYIRKKIRFHQAGASMKLRVKTTKALRGPSVAVRYANFMKTSGTSRRVSGASGGSVLGTMANFNRRESAASGANTEVKKHKRRSSDSVSPLCPTPDTPDEDASRGSVSSTDSQSTEGTTIVSPTGEARQDDLILGKLTTISEIRE